MKKLVVLSGAGISAESGISTFRDSDGMWENFNVDDVATIEAWYKNPVLVQDFYNQRRRQVVNAQPNDAHKAITRLQDFYDVYVITQNVDDLHERAGTENVMHLHGNIRYAKSSNTKLSNVLFSSKNKETYYLIEDGKDLKYPDDVAPDGFPLRPHVVWFGEDVPLIPSAIEIIKTADLLIVVGTSMKVYPAASLINYLPIDSKVYYIDPDPAYISSPLDIQYVEKKAVAGFKEIFEELIKVC